MKETGFSIVTYDSGRKTEWDCFVSEAKNATFLFYRDYMDYHSDVFSDHSLMIYRSERLFALLPANRNGDALISHEGLTYGGMLLGRKATMNDVMEAFSAINTHLKQIGINRVIYKPMPTIYHQIPAQEDLYALYRLNARLTGRNISSSIFQRDKIRFSELRRRGVKKAEKNGLKISLSNDIDIFWDILSANLQNKYHTLPVHTVEEISLLRERFPENIKLYTVSNSTHIVAGTLLYISSQVVHTQYIAANAEGKQLGALDLLFDQLINKEFTSHPYFDFGHSSEDMGEYLNKQLIFQKEGFGGRGIVYDTYEYTIFS